MRAAEFLLQTLQHPEHGEGLGGGGAPAGRRRQERATGLEFAQQPLHPLRLVHLAVGHRQQQVTAELIDGIAVAGALLTDVQAGQGEGEDVHLAEQVLQGFAAQAGGIEALLDQLQVDAEFLHRAVVQLLGRSGVHQAGQAGFGMPEEPSQGDSQPASASCWLRSWVSRSRSRV